MGYYFLRSKACQNLLNIDDVDKIILPELHYNHAAMEQYYFRFIRYTSRNFKQVVFLIYENSIEVNLLKMILAKEKLNLYEKSIARKRRTI